jgi:hypothetical protein
MEQEEYVRSRWGNVKAGVVCIYIGEWAEGNHVATIAGGWPEAYAFTLERERQIKDVESQIAFMHELPRSRQGERWNGILGCIQSTLADLQRGMKIEAPNE